MKMGLVMFIGGVRTILPMMKSMVWEENGLICL